MIVDQLKRLQNTGQGANLIIECSDGQKLHVHRHVLLTFTSFFEELITSPHDAAADPLVRVDFESDVTTRLLKLLYGGDDPDVNQAIEMLPLAVRFRLDSVERLLVELMQKSFNDRDLFRYLYLGETHESVVLQDAVVAYFEQRASERGLVGKNGEASGGRPLTLFRLIDGARHHTSLLGSPHSSASGR